MKTLITTLLVLSTLLSSQAFADGTEFDIPVDSRIKILTYSPHDVYLINTKYGYQTSVVFAPNEEIVTVSVGDRSLWQIIPNGNRIFIRPMEDNVATNMTVITNMREYNFDIKSVESGKTNNMYVAQFRYPGHEKTSANNKPESLDDMQMPESIPPTRVTSHPDTAISIPTLDTQRLQNPNTNYSYAGPDSAAPQKVYDDGKFTYFAFAAITSPAPRAYIVDGTGKEILTYSRIEGNRLVVHNVAPLWVIDGPGGKIRIYNELLNPESVK